jgi:glycosyltransferase involved in cell wall biosynthesis
MTGSEAYRVGRSVLHVLPHPGGGGDTYVDALSTIEGYRVTRRYLASSSRPGLAVGSVALRAIAAQWDARAHTVLHVHGELASTICLPGLAALPSVVTLHGLHLLRRLDGPSKAAAKTNLRLVGRAASRTICVSQAEHAELLDVVGARAEGKALMIHNGVAPLQLPSVEERAAARAELGISATTAIGVSVGSLDEHKDPLSPILAAIDVARAGADLKLIVVGDGPLRPRLEQVARENGGTAVELVGFRRDVRRILAAADFFVLSSRREGLSYSVLEAMSLGLPAVVSDAPGNPEAVGDTGIVVPYGDVRGFAAAFASLVNDERERLGLGTRARQRATGSFHVDDMVRQTRQVYDEVARERRNRP